MKVTICVLGSMGDIQPLVALGKGLQSAGHSITIATPDEFALLVQQSGIRFHPIRGLDPKQSMQKITGEASQNSLQQSQLVQSIRMTQLLIAAISEIGESCWEACQGADLCISNMIPPGVPSSVAEKLAIPHMYAMLQPSERTSEFPNMLLSTRSYGAAVNQLTYSGFFLVLWGILRSSVNSWRQQHLFLPPLKWSYFSDVFSSPVPRLYGFSRHVIPKPKGWSEQANITGYWFLEQAADWHPQKELVDFLESGPPPISIGFGSMVANNKEEIAEISIQALTRAKQRGILLTGWGGLHYDRLPEGVLTVESVPHEWLFPRIAAVVHHGGAGTTAAGLRAGVPTIIVPFITDQPFWGKRVYDLGVGPKPIPRRRLTKERLADAITEAVTNSGMRQRAAELGRKIRAENGITNAVEVIHQFINHRHTQ
ncbi:MAG: glycosyltransferase [Proteobacteria bacterium]|nr:glycosyltransferase [Pseudomonadota bacterium]MBU1569694.1 glycosyltransferase [Pseudomonadota bacterium]